MKIRIGTRASKLALAQTSLVEQALHEVGAETEIICIRTRGDKVQNRSLAEISRNQTGVFVSELEQALLTDTIDIAVHSAKDLPVRLADGLEIGAVLRRSDCRDVLVTLPESIQLRTIGTGSIRRRQFLQKLYPDAVCKDIRGNIDTRLQKLKQREYDAIVLAAAGLERLHLLEDKSLQFRVLETSQMLPAACQGIIAAECRQQDKFSAVLQEITDTETMHCFETERHVLALLGGDCSIPISALAQLQDGKICLTVTRDCQNIQDGNAPLAERFRLAEELTSIL